MSKPVVVSDSMDFEQIKKARKREQNLEVQALSDIRFVLGSAEGRRFLWKVLSYTHMFHSSMHASGSQTSFNEGERHIGLKLWNDFLKADEHFYPKLLEEQRKGEF